MNKLLKTEYGDVYLNGVKLQAVIAVEVKEEVGCIPIATITLYLEKPIKIEAGVTK